MQTIATLKANLDELSTKINNAEYRGDTRTAEALKAEHERMYAEFRRAIYA